MQKRDIYIAWAREKRVGSYGNKKCTKSEGNRALVRGDGIKKLGRTTFAVM